jgi:Cu2+-containing amine oxidase
MKQSVILVNIEKMTAEIDVSKNQIVVVKDGQVIPVKPPASGYGDQLAVWLGGKVDRIESTEKKKL